MPAADGPATAAVAAIALKAIVAAITVADLLMMLLP